MSSVILVEGFDNTGKTTLVNLLARRTGLPVVHSGALPTREDIIKRIYDWNKIAQHRGLIMDRIPLVGEQIYGKILRGRSLIDEVWGLWWSEFLSLDPIIIYCRPPREVILSSICERDQMGGVVNSSRKLLQAYDQFIIKILWRGVKVLVYDYTVDPTAVKLLEEVFQS